MTASRNSQAHIAPTAGGVPSSPSLALSSPSLHLASSRDPVKAETAPLPAVSAVYSPWTVKSKGWL